ncbi:MAG: hypothetical protein ABIO44_07800, partial [Saprospiraceae bacterium]
MKLRNSIILVFIACSSIFSQEFQGIPVEHYSKSLLDLKFRNYQLIELDVNAIQNSLNNRSNIQQLKIKSAQINWDLTLNEFNMFNKDFYLSVGEENKVVKKYGKPDIRTFKVVSNSKRAGRSCLTLADHFIYGFIEEAGVRTHIEPLRNLDESAGLDQFIIYSENDVIPIAGLKCGSDELMENAHLGENEVINKSNGQRGACVIVDVALACDKTIHDAKGGITGAENFVTGVMNDVQTNYDDEFTTSVEFSIATIFVATSTSTDPWNGLTTIDAHLNKHRDWANGGGYGGAGYGVATAWT